jgi:hypothetical protein
MGVVGEVLGAFDTAECGVYLRENFSLRFHLARRQAH